MRRGRRSASIAKADPINLDQPGEWWGLWWLPEDPDQQVPGILRYSPDGGPVFSLIGTFENRIMSSPSPGLTMIHEGTRTWDVIHGAAEQRKITLLGCVPNGGTRTSLVTHRAAGVNR